MTPHLRVGRWGARFGGRSFPCAIGRGRIGVKRCEGDGVTPRGIWRLTAVLARPDRVRRRHTRAIGRRDGWSDDPRDPAYNRAIRQPHPYGHERLWRADPLYDLIGVLDVNAACVPGAGSALFLHVWRGPRRPTAGCVGFRIADLRFILDRWRPSSRVIIR